MGKYLFKSERLGFRNWTAEDLDPMTAINADPAVMRFFPGTQAKATTKDFIDRKSAEYQSRGYTYFAVELLDSGKLIGFIGLSYQDFESAWTPFVDIGWRLNKVYWGRGLATEGANRVLEFGFTDIKLEEIYAIAPAKNLPSINVMKKIGMQKIGDFDHPKLQDYPELMNCVVYQIRR